MDPTQTSSAELLDQRLPDLIHAAQLLRNRPPMGWIAALRIALGMSAGALARRLKVSHSTLLGFEKAERSGRITIATMQRIAEALDAELVVAVVPRRPVSEQLRAQAERIASDEFATVTRTMALEDQPVEETRSKRQFEHLVASLLAEPKKLWR